MPIKKNTQKRGRERYKMDGCKSRKKKKPPMKVDHKGNMNKSSTQTPLVARNILDNKRGRTPERTLSLEKPSLRITTHLEIEAACTHFNTIDTFCL
jgi:hypothetical protein